MFTIRNRFETDSSFDATPTMLQMMHKTTSRATKKAIINQLNSFLVEFGVVPVPGFFDGQQLLHVSHVEAFVACYVADQAAPSTVVQYGAAALNFLSYTDSLVHVSGARRRIFFANIQRMAGSLLACRAKVMLRTHLDGMEVKTRALFLLWILTGLRRSSLVSLSPADATFLDVEDGPRLRLCVPRSKVVVKQTVFLECNCSDGYATGDATYCLSHGLRPEDLPRFPLSERELTRLVNVHGFSLQSPRRALACSILRTLENELCTEDLQTINQHFLWTSSSNMIFHYGFDASDYTCQEVAPAHFLVRRIRSRRGAKPASDLTRISLTDEKRHAIEQVLEVAKEVNLDQDEDIISLRKRILGPTDGDGTRVPCVDMDLTTTRIRAGARDSLREAMQYYSGNPAATASAPKRTPAPKRRSRSRSSGRPRGRPRSTAAQAAAVARPDSGVNKDLLN